MRKFAKIFETARHQVLFYKDFENEPSGKTTYHIVGISQHDGGNATVSYSYKSEAKRDDFFDRLTEEHAFKHLEAVAPIFGN